MSQALKIFALSVLFSVPTLAADFMDLSSDIAEAQRVLAKAYYSSNAPSYPSIQHGIALVMPALTLNRIQMGSDQYCIKNRFGYVLRADRSRINLCPLYFRSPLRERVLTLIHESYHVLGYNDPAGHQFERGVALLAEY